MAKLYNFFLLTCFLVMIPTLHANVKEDKAYWQKKNEMLVDSYWKEKADVANRMNQEAYTPDPYVLTTNLTDSVDELLIGDKKARRNLRGKKDDGRCEATNPIDRCWRCDPKWADNRKKLADCVQGFGRNTVGGKFGSFYVVNSSTDNDMVNPVPGTLRHAVTRNASLWIIFAHSMTIRLNQELIMASDKTVDGRGVTVIIEKGAGFMLQSIRNVIIHGIKIFDIVEGSGGMIRDNEFHFGTRTKSDGDGISIFGSSHIWVDHVSMRNCYDGLIDAIMGSTAITISNSHFTDHNESFLFGANENHTDDKIMQITLAFNHFGKRLTQRMPRVRYGFVHVVNNDYTHWEMYAIGGSSNPTIISEGNRYVAPNDTNAKEVTKRIYGTKEEWSKWQWRSVNDEFKNGAIFVEAGANLTSRPFSRKDMITAKNASYVGRLTRHSGWLKCIVGHPC